MSDSPRTRLRVRPRHVIRWVAIVIVLVLIATVVYAVYNYQHFVGGVTHINAIPTTTSVTKTSSENILLVGDDHRPANASQEELKELGTTGDGGGTNTDSMLVLHIPSGGGTPTLISFPRDSWVTIPGYGKAKLNAAFAYGSAKGGDAGGAQLLISTIENLSGLHIDHFVRISMVGFYDVAKALGPIQVCLVNAVDDHYSTFSAPAGVSTLDAKQALAFVRQRHGLPNGDIDREARQRYFLNVEAKKFLSFSTLANPSKLNKALTAVSGAIQTDPDLNFLSLAAQLRQVASGSIKSESIPISGTPTIYYNGSAVSIVEVDTAKMPAFIASLDETPTASSAAAAAPVAAPKPSAITVTVLNGSGVSGAAGTNSTTLDSAGFKTTTPSTVSTRSATTIQYPASMAAAAAVLAKYVPGATTQAVTGVDRVTLVLGTDGASAKSKPTASSGSGSSGSGSSGSGSSGSGSSGSGSSGSGSAAKPAATKSAAATAIPCIN